MEIESNKNYENSSNEKDEKDSIGKFAGFFLFRQLINGYNDAKNLPEEERKNIKKYGVLSIILCVISLTVSISCLVSTFMDFRLFGFSYFLLLIAYIFGGIVVGILLAIYGFVFGVMQARLNRKAIGIFGVVLSVLSFVASVVLIAVLIV